MESSNPLLRKFDLAGTDETVGTMTLNGVVNKCGILFLLCMASAVFSWMNPELAGITILGGLIGGLISCLVGTFKPTTTPFTAPIYAVCEGLLLGAVSYIFNLKYHGIMANALLLTFGVLGIMLTLYVTRIIKVTQRLAMGIVMATGAVMLTYIADMVLGLFHINVPMIHSSGPIGIGFSLLIVGIASFNLLLDFAVIETSIRRRAPKYMEWYCGMALLVTMVWLYLEILRLLAKMRDR